MWNQSWQWPELGAASPNAADGVWVWLVAALMLGLVSLTLWLRAQWLRRRRRQRARHAASAELDAMALLARRGYEIVDRQATRRWPVRVGAELVEVELRVDYLVTRRGRLYVADAKSGRLAPSIRHGSTRRQLLEYLIAYRADAALLVDMETRKVLEVHFPAANLS